MPQMRTCRICSDKYEPSSGGFLYCRDCRAKVRSEAVRDRTRLYHLSKNPYYRKLLGEPASRLRKEAEWAWACGVCGMKWEDEGEATTCCAAITLRPAKPYCYSEGYIVWHGELLTKDRLEKEGVLSPMDSALGTTTSELTSLAVAAAS